MSRDSIKKLVYGIGVLAIIVIACFTDSFPAYAERSVSETTYRSVSSDLLTDPDTSRLITDKDRESAYLVVVNYMNEIQAMYNMSLAATERMNNTFYQFNVYVANTQMTLGELKALIEEAKVNIKATAGEMQAASSGEKFIYLSSDVGITNASYGQTCTVVLGLINLGNEPLTNLIVTPEQSNDPTKWPFAISTASDAQMIDYLPNASSMADSEGKTRVLYYSFTVSSEAKTGLYPIPFKIQYYRNGVAKETTITTFANINGLPENGSLITTSGNTSTPRMIVTGFTTDPAEVCAGDTFTLYVNVQNTSSTTRVSNIQFDFKAAATGATGQETYDAFLPTSGASSIYIESLYPKAETTLTIEMTARGDLTQKPYVINLESNYEGENNSPYKSTTSISVPIHQEARVGTSDADLLPSQISVGGTSNIMFDINNMGKTTLYNIQVTFDENYLSGGSKYIGMINSGTSGNVDVNVTGVAPNPDGTVNCHISYEDASGNVTEFDKPIFISITDEMPMEDYYYDDMYMEESQGGGAGKVVGIIVAVLVVGGIVALVVTLKVKKAKKKKAELAELEQEEDDDLL